MWFADEGISGAVKALECPEFSELFKFVRKGDTLIVPAVYRLGRDTIDILHTVEALQAKGVSIISLREGFDLSTPIGKANHVGRRRRAGPLKYQGPSDGKALGREKTIDDIAVAIWRKENSASIQATAEHFGISPASVKRACKAA